MNTGTANHDTSELTQLRTAASRQQDQTSFVVHELKQPLNRILMLAGKGERNATSPEEKLRYRRMREASIQLDSIITDMTDVTFVATGSFALHRMRDDIADVCVDCIAKDAPYADIFVHSDVPEIEFDPDRIAQVMTNLLTNAKKFSPENSPIRVSVERIRDEVVVSVTNEGRCIPPSERERIFEVYYRGKERPTKAMGLGIGLYLCKMFVEQHGGSIWTDGDDHQVRFNFSLPMG